MALIDNWNSLHIEVSRYIKLLKEGNTTKKGIIQRLNLFVLILRRINIIRTTPEKKSFITIKPKEKTQFIKDLTDKLLEEGVPIEVVKEAITNMKRNQPTKIKANKSLLKIQNKIIELLNEVVGKQDSISIGMKTKNSLLKVALLLKEIEEKNYRDESPTQYIEVLNKYTSALNEAYSTIDKINRTIASSSDIHIVEPSFIFELIRTILKKVNKNAARLILKRIRDVLMKKYPKFFKEQEERYFELYESLRVK